MTDKLPLIELFFSLSILALALWELYRTPKPGREEDDEEAGRRHQGDSD